MHSDDHARVPAADGEAAERELALHSIHQSERAVPAVPVAVAGAVAVLRHHVGSTALAIFVLATLGDALFAWGVNFVEKRRIAHEPPGRRYRFSYAIAYGVFGASWGTLPLGARIAGDDTALWISVIVSLAVSVVMLGLTATSTAAFVAGYAALGSATLGSLFSAPADFRIVGFLGVLYVVLLVSVHVQLRNAVVDAIHQKHRNATLNERLAHEATHDRLTGLANRTMFGEQVNNALARAQRTGSTVAVLFLDLDRFKLVNDSLGHEAGDRLLEQVANRIRQSVRQGDIVARLGGDEFTVLLQDLHEAGEALTLAERIKDVVSQPFFLSGREVRVGVSIGVAFNDDLEADGSLLSRNADQAMYRAKDRGRGRVEVFGLTLQAELEARIETERDLRHALDAGELTVWYQPEVCLQSRATIGVEALVRWRHPERGVLNAAEFLPIAAEVGLEDRISLLAVREAMDWLGSVIGGVPPDFRLRINVPPRILEMTSVAERFHRRAARLGLDPRMIMVEITERGMLRDFHTAAQVVADARRRGMGISLDDVGTGHASLELLRRLPLDDVKIDRLFVRGVREQDADRAVVAAVVAMAQRLGLTITAEGIEHEDEAVMLLELGCTTGQGYLFGRAMPPADIERLLGVAVRRRAKLAG